MKDCCPTTHTHAHTYMYIYRWIDWWFLNTHGRWYSYKPGDFYLPIVKWFQVLLYNRYNSCSVICLYTVCPIWPIDMALSGATTVGQRRLWSDGNKGVLRIPQIFKAGASPLDCLMSYQRHWASLNPLQRCSQGILHTQLTDIPSLEQI